MIEDLNNKLHDWDDRLAEAERKAAGGADQSKAEFRKQKARALEKRQELQARLDLAREQAGEGWERTSRELDDAWKAFKRSASDVVDAFRA